MEVDSADGPHAARCVADALFVPRVGGGLRPAGALLVVFFLKLPDLLRPFSAGASPL